jgi:hypothetical protein
VIIHPIPAKPASSEDTAFSAMDRLPIPETAGTWVVVKAKDSAPRIAFVRDLSPPRWRDRSADRKYRTPPSRGISVVWQASGDIWIGVRGERDITGGLWHSRDGGESWNKVRDFFSITSLYVLSESSGRKETLLVAEQRFRRVEGSEFVNGETRLMKQVSDHDWSAASAPAHGSNSEIEICGTPDDGKLYVRVDSQIHRQTSRSLYRTLLESMQSSQQ